MTQEAIDTTIGGLRDYLSKSTNDVLILRHPFGIAMEKDTSIYIIEAMGINNDTVIAMSRSNSIALPFDFLDTEDRSLLAEEIENTLMALD